MLTINPKEVSLPILQSYLQGAIAPRPIAFASTIDLQGNVNLSPFSFFNVFGTNPPTLIFSPNRRVRDGSQKHTFENVLAVDEVVINMVDFAMVEQMSLSSCEYEKGVNEFTKAGFTEVASEIVKPPRVGESKAAFECKVRQIIQMSEEGGSPNLVICEVLLAHFSEDILNEKGLIDPQKTDWVARMGGDWYCRASGDSVFELPKPSIHKGIGFDNIPDDIKSNAAFTKNELARLANIDELPNGKSLSDIDATTTVLKAKGFLKQGLIKEAWQVLLNIHVDR